MVVFILAKKKLAENKFFLKKVLTKEK